MYYAKQDFLAVSICRLRVKVTLSSMARILFRFFLGRSLLGRAGLALAGRTGLS